MLPPTVDRACLLCLPLLALALGGCGGEAHDRYLPQSDAARQAVEISLAAWKDGQPHETIRSSEPHIDVYDARWREGRKLQSFEIVEELPSNPHPAFKVRLRFAGGLKDEEATYRVMGIDPLMVFREEDYARATGM